MSDSTESAGESPGWAAIDAALWPIYGDLEPYHVGTVIPYALGGPDPIHGISVYKNAGPSPHWHFVTYGFSELWAKESTDADVSGYGFELTFRPTCLAADEKPPNWALNFLQNLGAMSSRRATPLVSATRCRSMARSNRARPRSFTRSALHSTRSCHRYPHPMVASNSSRSSA